MIFDIWGTERRRGLTAGDKNYLIKVARGKCENCGKDIIGKGITPNIHHIVEFASRGSDGYHNLIVLCPDCHSIVRGIGISKEKLRAKIEYRLPKKLSTQNTMTEKASAKKTAVKKTTTRKSTAKKTTAVKAKPKKTATKKTAGTKAKLKKSATKKTAGTKTKPKKATTRKTPKKTIRKKRS